MRELEHTYAILFAPGTLKEYGMLPVPTWLHMLYADANGSLSKSKDISMALFTMELDPKHPDIDVHRRSGRHALGGLLNFRDFVTFGRRLQMLKTYMDFQKPRGIRGLWADNRDSLSWYTFWAVIIVGGISLILAILGVGLSAAQTVATFQGLQVARHGP